MYFYSPLLLVLIPACRRFFCLLYTVRPLAWKILDSFGHTSQFHHFSFSSLLTPCRSSTFDIHCSLFELATSGCVSLLKLTLHSSTYLGAMASGAAARSSCGFLLVVTTAAFVACQSEAFSVPNNNSNTNCQSLSGNKVARSSSQLFQRRPENPITSLFSDMASSILTSGKSADFDVRGLSRKLKSVAAASWDEIRANLESKQTSEEKAFRSNVEKGIGRASPLNKIRLFDESNTEKDIRVTLYRDHASWCPYCQKVWMTLEEKKIPYRIEKVNMRCYGDKTREFLSLQPNGNIVR